MIVPCRGLVNGHNAQQTVHGRKTPGGLYVSFTFIVHQNYKIHPGIKTSFLSDIRKKIQPKPVLLYKKW